MFNTTPQHTTNLQICSPKTSDHRRGMKWFTSLTNLQAQLEDDAEEEIIDDGQFEDDRVSLQHSVQLYGVFVETGDDRYLDLAEDFLKYTLDSKDR